MNGFHSPSITCVCVGGGRVVALSRSFATSATFARMLAAAVPFSGGVIVTQLLADGTLLPDLQQRFVRPGLAAQVRIEGIIALGGHGARIVEAVRLAKDHPKARLIITGRGEERWHAYARAAGIEPERLIIEPHSRNTYENGIFASRVARPRAGERWLLVTSDAHMPRAMGVFRKAGFEAVAWPVHLGPAHQDAIQHEWLGLLAYRLLGRTDALLPAPDDHIPTQPGAPSNALAFISPQPRQSFAVTTLARTAANSSL